MVIGKLSAAKVRSAGRGMHGDGGGLWLQVAAGKSWGFRYTFAGKARQMGLGSAASVSLARARELAAEARAQVADGVDPLEARQTARQATIVAKAAAITFEAAAERYIAAHSAGWRNAKHAAQWAATLTTHAYPHIGTVAAAEVDTAGVLRVLEPLWEAGKIETGVRLRGRIEAVLDYATVQGWRAKGFNPAAWKGHLSHTLAAPSKARTVQHHAALPWRQAPVFVADLAGRDGIGARALQFAILTAARSGEARGVTWPEIDVEAALWTVPAARMKAGREHRVPLSAAALAVLATMTPFKVEASDDKPAYVFPGMRSGRPLSDMSLTAVLRRMDRGDITAHGFRSMFRDWCAETGHPADIAEAALAHVVGDKTVAAYQRGDLLERRRKLMDSWANYCGSVPAKFKPPPNS